MEATSKLSRCANDGRPIDIAVATTRPIKIDLRTLTICASTLFPGPHVHGLPKEVVASRQVDLGKVFVKRNHRIPLPGTGQYCCQALIRDEWRKICHLFGTWNRRCFAEILQSCLAVSFSRRNKTADDVRTENSPTVSGVTAKSRRQL